MEMVGFVLLSPVTDADFLIVTRARGELGDLPRASFRSNSNSKSMIHQLILKGQSNHLS